MLRDRWIESLARGAFQNKNDMAESFASTSDAIGYIAGINEFLNFDMGGEDD